MVRIARVVAPGFPNHITQRGNRRQETFFNDADYRAYIDLMSEWCCLLNVEVWAYCLMPNHIHLIAVPDQRMVCDERLVKHIVATHNGQMFVRDGGGIFGKGDLPHM